MEEHQGQDKLLGTSKTFHQDVQLMQLAGGRSACVCTACERLRCQC